MTEPPLPEESIFAQTLEIKSAAERGAFLDQACGDNQALRAEVEGLLHAHGTCGDLLDLSEKIATILDTSSTEAPVTFIGPYKLLEQIGEGGFGVVFVAEQTQPVRRRVALKLLKRGLDTRQVVARFEAERQALAIMDHPNIAKVFDGGATVSGLPYFVMELFKGIPITDFCDQNRLTLWQRLELIVAVCGAVQHAHQKGIIHRDLKPSNVLVTMHDVTPVVKVIDFGVAKALEQELTERTLFTGFAQIIGTPLYMSPEQAGQSVLDIDTRSDIYSLGVMLYELLTGTTPFGKERLKQAAFDEIRRIIGEEEPPKPSTRLSESRELLQSISAQRQTEPAKLLKLVRGDLDWIVMKCLEKDRNRRYATATALADDIERCLNNEPVVACPPSTAYRLGKFARRNKARLVVALIVIATLLVGTTVATWQAVRATRAKAAAAVEKLRADEEAATANSVTNYLQQMLYSIEPGAGEGLNYTVRQLLDDYENDLERQSPARPQVQAALHATLGRAYACFGEAAKGRKHLTRALELRRSVFGDKHEKYAETLVDYSRPDVSDPSKRPEPERETDLRQALAIYRERGVGGRPLIYAFRILQWHLIEEAAVGMPGKWQEVEQVSYEGLAEARKSPGVEFPETVLILRGLVRAKTHLSQHAEAEKIARESLAMVVRLLGPEHDETGWTYFILAEVLRNQNKFKAALQANIQALTVLRKALPPQKRGIAIALTAAIDTVARAEDSHALADLFPSLRQPAELQSMFREVLATTNPTSFYDYDPAVAAVGGLARFTEFYSHLSDEYASAGKTKEAKEFRQTANLAWQSLQTQLGGSLQLLPYAYGYGAVAWMKAGQPQRAKELGGKLLSQVAPNRNWVHNYVAWFLATAEIPSHRDPGLAIQLAKKAVESDPQSSSYWKTLGVARYRAGDWKQAISDLERSAALGNGGDTVHSLFLAMAHSQLGEKDKAHAWYEQAKEDGKTTANDEIRRFRAEAAQRLGVD
jgi:serine/threonine protein kinase/tetratricopeptide (TPR) repeat protein